MDDFVIVATTTDDRAVAEDIARAAVEARLGACARISTGLSVFRWDGEVQSRQEYVVEVKTVVASAAALEQVIVDRHNYRLPEIVVTPIVGGSVDYIEWLRAESAGPA